MKVYQLSLSWFGCFNRLAFAFTHPPTRKDASAVLRNEWLKLKPELQDNIWELLLIIDFIPEIPWVGTIETWYGVIKCAEKEIIENGPNQPRTGDAG